MDPSAKGTGTVKPAVVLTYLAPAPACNQRCPRCILELAENPVRSTTLSPEHFAQFASRFIDEGIPIRAVTFQGYEVTLPKSWPYVERVFDVAKAQGVRRSLITNGMLLHRWADALTHYQPRRISISLDGSSPESHDPYRGLPGAFDATIQSVRRFIQRAPSLQDRLAVASTLFGAENVDGLTGLPRVLHELGISRWMVSMETIVDQGRQRPRYSIDEASSWLEQLAVESERHGLRFQVNDELGHFREDGSSGAFHSERVFDPRFLYRLYPDGSLQVGEEILDSWNASTVRRWDPRTDDPLDTVQYWEHRRDRLR